MHTVTLGFKPKYVTILSTTNYCACIYDSRRNANKVSVSYIDGGNVEVVEGAGTGVFNWTDLNVESQTFKFTFNITNNGFTFKAALYGAYRGGLGTMYYFAI